MTHDGAPIGLIQWYLFSAYTEDLVEMQALVSVPPNALSVDYLIGVPISPARDGALP